MSERKKLKMVASVKAALAGEVARMVFRRTASPPWHFLCFTAFAAATYWLFPKYLLQHHDGKYFFSLMKNLSTWRDTSLFSITSSHLAGMGGNLPPLVPSLVPTLWPMYFLSDPTAQIYLLYTLSAILLFCSTWLMAQALHFPKSICLGAAWMSFFYCLLLQDIAVAAPLVVWTMSWTNLMVAAFAYLGHARGVARAFAVLVFVALSLWSFAAFAAGALIAYPGLVVLLSFLVAANNSRSELVAKVSAAILAGAALLAFQVPEFVELLTHHTARVAMAGTMDQQVRSFYTAGPVFRDEIANWIILVLGVSGAVLFITAGGASRMHRCFAGGLLVAVLALTATGSVSMAAGGSPLPAPLYFAWTLLPTVALFAVICAYRLLDLQDSFTTRAPVFVVLGTTALFGAIRAAHGLSTAVPVLGVLVVTGLFALAASGISGAARWALAAVVLSGIGFSAPYSWLDTRSDTRARLSLYPSPLTDYLQQRVGLTPGSIFSGVIDDAYLDGPPVPNLGSAMLDEWHKNLNKYGNGYRTFGWNYFDIPTLSEFSQYISPGFYFLYTALLNRPEDRQTANHLALSQINLRALAMMGVSYIVANRALDGLSAELEWTGMRVIAIQNPNLFSYSPTQVVQASDALEAIKWLQRGDIDPRRTVILTAPSPLSGSLTPIQKASATAVSGGWRVSAQGDGKHILLMPLQFSHCWSLIVEAGDADAQLVRANVGMTALLFQQTVTALLSYRFQAPNALSCRRADHDEDVRLGIIAGS